MVSVRCEQSQASHVLRNFVRSPILNLIPSEPRRRFNSSTMVANSRNNVTPVPAYFPTSVDSPLHPPKELYDKLRNLEEKDLVKSQDFVIPPRSGKAWKVAKGQVWRLSTPEGPQVGDLNIWNQHDPRERFWAARTRQLQGSHMIEGDRLWSNLPFMRPLCGIIRDGCEIKDAPTGEGKGDGKNGGREEARDERGGVTKWGGRCHDLLGTRCDPYGSSSPSPSSLPTLIYTRSFSVQTNDPYSIQHAHRLLLRLPLSLQSSQSRSSIWLDRVRRPRRAKRLPSNRSRLPRSVLYGSFSRHQVKLHYLIRRTRPPVRT
jgi:uncharacterized protein YcgI (DUF1989 family)